MRNSISAFFLVVGKLFISSFEICEEAKSSSGSPMIFFRLVPTDPATSSFTGNDVYGVRMNKDMLKCELGAIFLMPTNSQISNIFCDLESMVVTWIEVFTSFK